MPRQPLADRSDHSDSTTTGARSAPLDLHEELSDPTVTRCTCAPVHLRLRSHHGELVQPRGGLVNSCDYCAMLAAVENAEMLALDALEGDAPTLWTVLTTRTATLDMAAFYEARRAVVKALKRRWPTARYAALLEYTEGFGPLSGGLRRPHWNLAWKGIPTERHEDAHAIISRVWCDRVDALPVAQVSTTIYSAENLFRYIALHFQKAAQTPPDGFRGQRFNCSRDYFTGCTRAVARARARESLRVKRELWKARRHLGADADAYDVELQAQLSYRLALATTWTLATASGGRLGKDVLTAASLADRLRRKLAATDSIPLRQ